ncbi:AraC family transcriptional regulator [Neobacillus mesonae]|nr:AraC family transcriptional regulator [Neobacillus mesonae]
MIPFYEIRSGDLIIKHNARQLTFPAHLHGHIEILYVFSGVQHMFINENAFSVHEGEAALILPDIVHRYYKVGQNAADAMLIIFNPRILGGIFPDLNLFQPATPLITRERIHEDAVYALKQINKIEDFAAKLGWTYIIMSHLLRHIELRERPRIPVQDMSKKIMEYLANHFTEPITLDSLASEFCVSKYYISRIFSERIKMNFRNYLSLLRVEYASNLIRTTDASFTTISSNAGFESQRTFNRVFYSIYGMSPREFRNNVSKYLK